MIDVMTNPAVKKRHKESLYGAFLDISVVQTVRSTLLLSYTNDADSRIELLDRHTLGEVTWLIDISTT